MKNFIKKQLIDFDENAFIHALKLFIVVALLVILYGLIFSGFQIVDEFEHLHASWLVSEGLFPYRDFFEHHHPLIWYIFAPIVSFFYNDVIVFYVVRGISFLVSIVTLLYMYKISLFFTSKSGGLVGISFYLCNIITAYNFYQFRPDNYMNLFFLLGIYYWFSYIENKKLLNLVISFTSFAVSLLFLQKIGLILIVIELIILWQIITKKIKLKNVIVSAIPPVALVCLFFTYIILNGAGIEYFSLNFRFNQALVYYFERGAFWYQNIFSTIYLFGLLVVLYFYKKKNIYFKIVSILYIAEFLMRGFYFSPHPNYYSLLTILLGLVISGAVSDIIGKYRIISILLVIGLFLNLGLIFNTISRTSEKHDSFKHYQLAKYVHENSSPNDLLMNGYDKNFNIYRKDASYYWFGLDMLIPVMEQEFSIKNLVDVNNLILTQKPKFVYMKNYVDLKALRTYGETKYSQVFIPSIINALYKKTSFKYLVELK